MSVVRERFIKAIEALDYDIDEEVLQRKTGDILKDVTKKYTEMFGTEGLSKSDIECINGILGGNNYGKN